MKLTINNENIYFEQTDKYKTIAIGVMMFTPFKKEYLFIPGKQIKKLICTV